MPDFHLKIAGQVGRVSCLFESTPYFLGNYASDEAATFSVGVSREDLELEKRMRDEEALQEGLRLRTVSDSLLERLAIQRKFAETLMERDILMVHGSAVAVDGMGFLFTAGCGTGKSTHTRLWRQGFGDRAMIINDDKPFLRMTSEGVLVCGSPWSGKHGLDTNTTVPLGGICLLERGAENRIFPLCREAVPRLTERLRWYMEPERIPQFDALARSVQERVPLWHLWCNRNPDAAMVSHSSMSRVVRFL